MFDYDCLFKFNSCENNGFVVVNLEGEGRGLYWVIKCVIEGCGGGCYYIWCYYFGLIFVGW